MTLPDVRTDNLYMVGGGLGLRTASQMSAPPTTTALSCGVSHRCCRSGREAPVSSTETGQVTGTKDKNYNLIWFTEACQNNALRLETYIQDAERAGDSEVADLFRRAQAESRQGGGKGKEMLGRRLTG